MSPRPPSWVPRRRRWGDAAPDSPEAARALILDAAARCIERLGIVRLTMADVAEDADISRPTLYKYFATKEAMLEAFLVRLLPDYLERVKRELRQGDELDLGARLVDTLETALRVAEGDPWGKRLLRGSDVPIVVGIMLSSESFLAMAGTLLEPILVDAERRGRLRWSGGASGLCGWVIRTLGSYLVFANDFGLGAFRPVIGSVVLPVVLRDGPLAESGSATAPG